MKNFLNLHIAVLGRNIALSLAELEAIFGADKVKPIVSKTEFIDFAYIDHPTPEQFIDRLGGTIKIVKIEQTIADKGQVTPAIIKSLTDNHFSQDHKKLVYGINVYPIQKSNEFFLTKLLKKVKPLLKSQKIASRYLNKNNQNVHTASILENHLVKTGTDINVFLVDNKIMFGHTIGIQNINSYSHRDYERPARDDKSGMLPPKLAQMLINLAYPALNKGHATIYDPFCGSGTILQEAVLMGHNAFGSDLSSKAVGDSKKNISWLVKSFKNNTEAKVLDIIEADATKTNVHTTKLFQKATAVVCEGYLGPAIAQRPSLEEIQATQKNLIPLYKQAFSNIVNNVKTGTIIVVALPVHYYRHKAFFLPQISDFIKQLKVKHIQYCSGKQHLLSPRKTLIYKRPQQNVGREIWVLKTVEHKETPPSHKRHEGKKHYRPAYKAKP